MLGIRRVPDAQVVVTHASRVHRRLLSAGNLSQGLDRPSSRRQIRNPKSEIRNSTLQHLTHCFLWRYPLGEGRDLRDALVE